MTCTDVAQRLDAFIDTELPSSELLEVARHAAACTSCDEAVRELAQVRDAVADTLRAEVETLDLSRVWPTVAVAVDRVNARRAWVRRLRSTPVWATALAAAASVALWFHGPQVAPVASVAPIATRTAAAERRPPNWAFIDRLAGKQLAVRREPKAGTTIIWVGYTPGANGAGEIAR
jgi:anti-sigma factor RsiW